MAAEIADSPAVTAAIPRISIEADKNEILKGVVAVVDVRSGYDNRSSVVSSYMRKLGATVVQRFSKKVTHVIFNEGKQSLYNKAKESRTHLLSVLWIDGCIREGKRVSEQQFPAFVDESYENPLIKRKVLRSMQPVDLEEGLAKTAALLRRRMRRKERLLYRKKLLDPNSATETLETNTDHIFQLTPNYYPGLIVYDSSSEDEEHAGVVPPPLARRLLNKFPDSPILLEAYRRRDEKHSRLKEENRLKESNGSDTIESEKVEIGKELDSSTTTKTPSVQSSTSKRTRTMAFSTSESEVEDKFKEMRLSEVRNGDWIGRSRPSIEEFKIRKPKAKRLSFSSEGSSSSSLRRSSNERVSELPTMVLTSFNPGERQTIVTIIQKLGKFRLSDVVEYHTTHVICGDVRRTRNVLFGTVRGCWLLSPDWVSKSFEVGKWIEEEPYELFENFPTAQICRLERVLASSSFHCKIFSDVGPIFVCSNTTIPAKDLRTLLSLAGAKVVYCHRSASIVIGKEFRRLETNVVCVSELWALNSISTNKTLSFNDFKLQF